MEQPKVSVVIPTLFRTEYVLRTLEDLLEQDYKNMEVVVVEQEKSSPEIVDFQKSHTNKIQYFFEEESTGPRNKNIGAKHTSGKYILFLDDDSRIPRDFVSRHVAVMEKDESIGAVSSKIIQPREPLEVETEGVVGVVRPYGKTIANYGSSTPAEMDTAHGCSMWRRDAFESVGGFDEKFDGNAMREESDLSLRVSRQGYKLIFRPDIEFVHIKAPMGGTRRKPNRMDWYFDFFHNDFLFFLKNLKWRWMPVFFFSKIRPILACGFYYGKGRPAAVFLPLRAYFAGYKTYRKEKQEQSKA